MKLTSTLSQYLDGAPIEKKTVAKLVRRASLNAVPFDFKKDMKQVLKPEVQQIDSGDHFSIPQTPFRAEYEDSQDLTSPFNIDFLSPVAHHHPRDSRLLGTPYQIDIPSTNSSHRNPCDFIYIGNDLDEQCDYLFYRVYTLSHPNNNPSNSNPPGERKDYNEAKRDVLNEWIGKRTFLSMCLALDVIDDRSVSDFEMISQLISSCRLTIQAAVNSFEKAASEATRNAYKLNSRCGTFSHLLC